MKFILLVTLICSFLDSGWCLTEWMKLRAELDQIQVLAGQMENQTREMELLTREMEILRNENQELRSALQTQMTTVLEEVQEVQNGVTSFDRQMNGVKEQVSNMFDQQVIQDERIVYVEKKTGELQLMDTAFGARITDLEDTVLQVTDADLEARIKDLEEAENTIAFHALIPFFPRPAIIPKISTVKFSDVKLNVGNGYDPATGVFTVPPGGDGYYYIATHFNVNARKSAFIELRVNSDIVCEVLEDTGEAGDYDTAGCSATVFLEEGDRVLNFYTSGTDTTPFNAGIAYNGFTGFRI